MDLQRGQVLIGNYCRNKKWPLFSGPAASRCSKACLYKVSLKKSRNVWLHRTNIKSNLTPKIEYIYILKPSNYNAKPWFLHLTAQKSKCPRRFWELDPEILHMCLICPCRAFCDWVFSSLFFSPKMWGLLWPKYPKKYNNPNICRKKKHSWRPGTNEEILSENIIWNKKSLSLLDKNTRLSSSDSKY